MIVIVVPVLRCHNLQSTEWLIDFKPPGQLYVSYVNIDNQ